MAGWRYAGALGMCKMINPSRPDATGSIGQNWNPLTDDGDALRLAVNVSVVVATYGAHVRIYTPYSEMLALEAKDQDPNYATRRAIVRAAAEIGRKMQEGGAA